MVIGTRPNFTYTNDGGLRARRTQIGQTVHTLYVKKLLWNFHRCSAAEFKSGSSKIRLAEWTSFHSAKKKVVPKMPTWRSEAMRAKQTQKQETLFGNVNVMKLSQVYSCINLDSKRVSILIEAVLPTSYVVPSLQCIHLNSKRASLLIEAVLPTLPMLYLPFNVYLDSKTVSILIEAVSPTLPMVYIPLKSIFTKAACCQHHGYKDSYCNRSPAKRCPQSK